MNSKTGKGRIRGSRHHRPHASTTIFSDEATKRIIFRGTLWYAQERLAEAGTTTSDNWRDLAGGFSKAAAARIAGIELKGAR